MMISVADARMIIRESVSVLPAHYQPLSLLQGRVLAEELTAPFPMPRFTNAAMDGFALRHADIAAASSETPVILQVIAEVAAGAVPVERVRQGTCAQIMTGAPMPDGADTVIPFEQTSGFGTSEVSIFSMPKKGANIRYAGEEIARGASLLPRGTVLTPGAIAVLAAFGIGGTMAYDLPKISLVTVGSELRLPGELLEGDAEIYNCNRSMMEALSRAWGIEPAMTLHAPDDRDALRGTLFRALAGSDMLVTAGGISTGEYDYVQELLREAGVTPRFWTVAQKPGKPLYFGLTGDGRPVFALPGNPVSAITCFIEYVVPALCLMQGRKVPAAVTAELEEPFPADRKRHRFLPGTVREEGGKLLCRVSGKVESHMITSLTGANAIIGSPPSTEPLLPGTPVTCTLLPRQDFSAAAARL
ncbi:MAG: molybdopterin molybdotransferase MoeA [Chlorobium sp.]|uniref:molybdopterin molybdotransferase MoeA n=1 Tax=Chlorobium sp. TaxID=1095 RepID=UPI002F3E5A6A